MNPKTRDHPTQDPKETSIAVRMAEAPLALIDAWIAEQKDAGLSRPEAIRRLVALALARPKSKRAKKSPTSTKSAQLAGEQLDRMSDRSASAEEQATRKRRLLRGPSEFRDVRKDRTKR